MLKKKKIHKIFLGTFKSILYLIYIYIYILILVALFIKKNNLKKYLFSLLYINYID